MTDATTINETDTDLDDIDPTDELMHTADMWLRDARDACDQILHYARSLTRDIYDLEYTRITQGSMDRAVKKLVQKREKLTGALDAIAAHLKKSGKRSMKRNNRVFVLLADGTVRVRLARINPALDRRFGYSDGEPENEVYEVPVE